MLDVENMAAKPHELASSAEQPIHLVSRSTRARGRSRRLVYFREDVLPSSRPLPCVVSLEQSAAQRKSRSVPMPRRNAVKKHQVASSAEQPIHLVRRSNQVPQQSCAPLLRWLRLRPAWAQSHQTRKSSGFVRSGCTLAAERPELWPWAWPDAE